MASVQQRPAGIPVMLAARPQVEIAKKKPAIKAWAALGAVFLAFQLYIYVKWITGPYFKSVPSGPTEVPGLQTMVWLWVPGGIVAMLGCIYWFVVRPWRRNGEPSTDGLLCLGWLTVLWQDPLVSYFSNQFAWSSIVPNMGSWTAEVPGWSTPSTPGGTMVEPVPFNLPLYVYALFTVTILTCWVMRKAKERFPNLGTLGVMGVGWAFIAIFDLVMEAAWARMGFYHYGGAIPELSLFHGHFYQFPLYEPVLWGLCWAACSWLRYFKNDKGETLAERGVSEMRISPRRRTLLRFLAITAALNCCYLGYIVAFNYMGLKGHAWPKDVQERSYMTGHLCGPETDQACPSTTMPIPKQGGVHFAPDGKLVIPKGVAPPGAESITKFKE